MNIFITDSDYSCIDKSFEYLLGFQPTLGGIIFDNLEFYVILDGRYFEKTKNISKDKIRGILENKNLKIKFVESKNIIESIIEILSKNNGEIIFEGKIAGEYVKKIEKELNKKAKILEGGYFTKNRILKTETEKENIKGAIGIIDKVFAYIQKLNKNGDLVGKTELEVRGIIISKIFEFGGEGESFDSIVAFGVNSAIPHHKTGSTKIGNGILLIDMGALYKGYCSDFTRTFWVGEKNEQYTKFKKIYDIVKSAHNNAFRNAKSGMIGYEIDYLTRDYISKKGYGDNFIHGTGHGLGLDIHEFPRIKDTSDDLILDNMIFTIEPGIYLQNEFGIRLEDIVIMENGTLIKYSKTVI